MGPLADEEPQSLTVSFPVAQAAQHLKYSYDFRYSNGDRPFFNANSTGSDGLQRGAPDYRRRVVEAVGGTFFFNTNEEQLCWYMDSNFCAPFHDLKRDLGSAENARLLVEGLTYALMGIGLFFYLCFFMVIICRAFGCNDSAHETHIDDEDGDGQLSCCERINSALRAVSHFNPMVLTIFLMLCILPPLLTTRIFRPCFQCALQAQTRRTRAARVQARAHSQKPLHVSRRLVPVPTPTADATTLRLQLCTRSATSSASATPTTSQRTGRTRQQRLPARVLATTRTTRLSTRPSWLATGLQASALIPGLM